MSGRLPPSTLEINQVHAHAYASAEAAAHAALYVLACHRMAEAGAPITVATVDACIAGELLRITYPQTGEQLAQAAYDRLIQRGVPKAALRVLAEAAQRATLAEAPAVATPEHRGDWGGLTQLAPSWMSAGERRSVPVCVLCAGRRLHTRAEHDRLQAAATRVRLGTGRRPA